MTEVVCSVKQGRLNLMKKLILILCEPRTGSNLLCEAMLSYEHLQPIYEFYLSPNDGLYVRPDNIPKDLAHKTLLTSEQKNHLFSFLNVAHDDYYNLLVNIYKNPIESLTALYQVTDKTLVVKIMHKQYNELGLDRLLDLPFVEVILLDRSNKLEEYVSHRKAIEYDQWYNVDTSNLKIKVDIDKFLEKKNWSLAWYNEIKNKLLNKYYLELNYEMDLKEFNQESFCNKFNQWLSKIELPLGRTDYKISFFKKQNNAPIEQSISNYKEIIDKI